MAKTAKDYVSAINDVISICKDAEEGFHGAAKAVEDAGLKSLFEEYSAERARFAHELQRALASAGVEPKDPAGIAGKLHSGWMAVKGTFTGHSAHEILEETERGEDLSLHRYREALDSNLPAELRALINEQYAAVERAHQKIRSLRDSRR